ncbi:MAG: hypothetical protein ACRD7E_04210 [Bryobacteraceae bacterium]
MTLLPRMPRLAACVGAAALFAGTLSAAEDTLMHCFAFTPVENVSDADLKAFYKATDALPDKIPGVKRVWYGKLRRPLPQFSTSADTRKKLAGGEKSATGDVTMSTRAYGVCMEMDDEKALQTYADHPAHKEWGEVYEKVRVPGTTTFDIIAVE